MDSRALVVETPPREDPRSARKSWSVPSGTAPGLVHQRAGALPAGAARPNLIAHSSIALLPVQLGSPPHRQPSPALHQPRGGSDERFGEPAAVAARSCGCAPTGRRSSTVSPGRSTGDPSQA